MADVIVLDGEDGKEEIKRVASRHITSYPAGARATAKVDTLMENIAREMIHHAIDGQLGLKPGPSSGQAAEEQRIFEEVAACLSTETKLVMSNRDETEQVL